MNSSITTNLPAPVIRSSEVYLQDLDDLKQRALKVWDYDPDYPISANLTNPTTRTLETTLSSLHSASHTLALQNGQSTFSTIFLALLQKGDTLLLPDNVYNPVKLFAQNHLTPLGIQFEIYDPLNLEDLKHLITPSVRLLYIEAPGSLTFEVPDLEALIRTARQHQIPTVMDNTYASAWGLKPLELGVDMVLESLSKHMSGHSDVYGGFISVNSGELYKKLKNTAVFLGHWLSPDDAERILRGMQTAELRLRHQYQTSLELIEFLKAHPSIHQVNAPFSPSSEYHSKYQEYFKGGCGLFSFTFPENLSDEQLGCFFKVLKTFRISYGWGGVHSLIVPGRGARKFSTMPKHLIRVYCGMQNPAELIRDLEQALNFL